MSLNCVSDVDILFKDWRFNGLPFSEFISKIPTLKTQKIAISTKEETNNLDSVKIYRLPLQRPYTIFEYGSKAICDYTLATSVYTELYIENNVSNIKHKDEGGRVIYFEFEQQLSAATYVNIEHILIGTFIVIVNITFGNKVISIHLSSGCGIKGLNVHHNYYIMGNKPWEYANDALITLCQDCHCKRHNDAKVPLYTNNHHLIKYLIPCSRCDGSGYLPQYNHVENGICFKCGGEGVVLDD